MINNYNVIENSEEGKIETVYEEWESTLICKSYCECYLPRKDCKVTNVNCKFEDKSGNTIAELSLPNNTMYSLYANKQGVTIVNDEKVIVHGWDKFDTACYLLKTNEKIWESNINKVCDIFVYADKLYAYCSTSKDELYLLSMETGKVIKKLLYHKSNIDACHIYRLRERFLVGYCIGYIFLFDMMTDELSMSSKYVTPLSKFFWLDRVERFGENKARFIYKNLNTSKGKIEFSEDEVDINDLILHSKKCSFHRNIPTEKENLAQEYKLLFS